MRWPTVQSDARRHRLPRAAHLSACLLLLLLAACAGNRQVTPPGGGVYKLGAPYNIGGRWYYPEFDPHYNRTGIASWYGPGFDGQPTANGELFDSDAISAAHPTLPLPSLVEVTNLENGRRLVVRVNDRGPFVGERLIDLSEAAARELGFRDQGLARVRVRFLKLADDARGVPPQPAPSIQTVAANAAEPQVRPKACAAPLRRYLVQIAALRDPSRAELLAQSARALAPVRLERVTGPVQAVRVLLGPVEEATAARQLLERARRAGYPEAFIVAAATARGCDLASVERG